MVFFSFPYSSVGMHTKERKIAMIKQLSFTRYEHKILPNFRQMISKAESTEDVKKFFVYTVIELFENIFEEKMDFEYENIALMPTSDPHYKISKRLLSLEDFASAWNDSDLPVIIDHLAESAMHRYKHLQKHPEKTKAKIKFP